MLYQKISCEQKDPNHVNKRIQIPDRVNLKKKCFNKSQKRKNEKGYLVVPKYK